MALASSKIVELHVVAPEDKEAGVKEKDYGVFKARIRDFDTSLRIELRTDALIAERKAVPDEVSNRARVFFTLVATFEMTAESLPDTFDKDTILFGDPDESLRFLLAYSQALAEAEERFRSGAKKATKA